MGVGVGVGGGVALDSAAATKTPAEIFYESLIALSKTIITTLSLFSFECKMKIHLKLNSLVKTGAEAAKTAADAGAEEEKDDDREDDPDPDDGTALAINREGT